MIELSAALEIVRRHAHPLGCVTRPLGACLGRVLRTDVHAREDIPLFDSSAVDGFALLARDTASASKAKPVSLAIVDEIQAGDTSGKTLRRGAMRILTGGPVPRGADAIVMKEHVTAQNGRIAVAAPVASGANIRRRGEEFGQGGCAISAGTRINPPVIGLLATLGYSRVKVSRLPRVALIITGNELRPPSSVLKPGQIRDSNSFMLTAALAANGIAPSAVLRAKDTRGATIRAIRAALRDSDIVVSVGGVSVGEYDHVKEACAELGIVQRFWRVAIKPGKPVYFGTLGKKLFFGLPGNPVAAILTFHLFVQEALDALQGLAKAESLRVPAVLDSDLRKKAGRMELVRVRLAVGTGGVARAIPTRGQESHMLGGTAAADGMMRFGREDTRVSKGTIVEVELFPWRQG